ncbi:Peptidase family M48 [Thalassovita litoralis]|uniref:Peptidase family M48 n=1 Tax=Thalassovita litoralis TaxID=1010611 RepID=A0A521FUQ7_9RHOB|nr:M48 family metalloprotease [Thalassovita litoralis]SMO99852.1 Peptidase family M48 [Thalassovita litoralis]
MRKYLTSLILAVSISGCGTTYVLPNVDENSATRAQVLFQNAKTDTNRKPASKAAAEARFNRVSTRVRPVAEQLCAQETAKLQNFNCKVSIQIDRDMKERNAYFTYDAKQQPIIRLSMPLLQDVRSDHEVAFVMSHEYGHLIGRHIEKKNQQAIVGAIILGAITAYSNSQAASAGHYYDPSAVERNMAIGAATGSMAYSQSYELESDTLGTRIASAAGYDPVKGAEFFARPEKAKTDAGKLSFWGTHPPDEKRLATVIAVDAQIKQKQALQKRN